MFATQTLTAFAQLSDLAAHHGVNRHTARNWKEKGRLVRIEAVVGKVNQTGKGKRVVELWHCPFAVGEKGLRHFVQPIASSSLRVTEVEGRKVRKVDVKFAERMKAARESKRKKK